jgi:putative ABC transport system substrate-binding protein
VRFLSRRPAAKCYDCATPGGKMRRRELIGLIATAAAWPLAARAQQSAMPVIGFLGSDSPELYTDRLNALRSGLKEAGYIEGQNVAIEYRWAEGRNDRLQALAADLVGRQVAVIATSTVPAALALKAATTTIPVVFFVAADPIALGLVASLNRPGGNLTGTTTSTLEIGSKQLQLLHEIVPSASKFGLLINPTSPNLANAQVKDMQTAAGTLGLQLEVLKASTDREVDAAFAALAQSGIGGLVISADSFLFSRKEQLAALAARFKIPAIFGFREFAAAGGLMSYGASPNDQHRIVGGYVGRILNGEKPANLPVQQATKVDLIINLKAAEALRLNIPLPLLGRADEVIE